MEICPNCKELVTRLFYNECWECSNKIKPATITTLDKTEDIFGMKHNEPNYCQTIYNNKD